MKTKAIIFAGFSILVALGMAWAAENMGAPDMTLYGGKTGEVPFPHAMHQQSLKDCSACHGIFPKEAGVIEKMKAGGDLKKKAVMNQCTKCHKDLKKAGEKTGPVSCRKCHQKK